MTNTSARNQIVTISIGDDLVLTQAIAASLAAEGIETELVLSSDPYVGLAHSSPHRLMISADDVDLARPIIEAHQEDAMIEAPAPVRRRGVRDAFAYVLLVMFAGGPLVVVAMVIRDLLSNA